MFRDESRVQVRAGQVFSALENVARTIVTDPKSSAEASCDIGRERRERVRGEKSAPSSNYQRGWENERVLRAAAPGGASCAAVESRVLRTACMADVWAWARREVAPASVEVTTRLCGRICGRCNFG